MAKWITLLVILLLAAGGSYYYYGYAPEIYKRKAQQALDDFSRAMSTKDRTKTKDTLQTLLTDDAKVRLEIRFFSLSQMQGGVPEVEDFTKADFMTFIDNTLYSLDDYQMRGQVQQFSLDADKKAASLTLTAQAWGDSESNYGASHINTRFMADITCEGHVVFDGKQTQFDKANCSIQMHSAPKIGQEKEVLQNPEALKQLLR